MRPQSLPKPLIDALAGLSERPFLAVLRGRDGDGIHAAIREALDGADVEIVSIDAELASLHPDGAVRWIASPWMGPPGAQVSDRESGGEAVGDDAGARKALGRIIDSWAGAPHERGLPGDDVAEFSQRAELLARWLVHCADLAARVAVIDEASSLDEGTIRVLRSALLGRAAPGLGIVLTGADSALVEAHHPLATLLVGLRAAQADDRAPAALLVEGEFQSTPEATDGPSLPSRGSSVELLDLLRAAPLPLPIDVVGSASLCAYRDRSPRGSWIDLAGLLDAGQARVDGRWLLVRPGPRGEGTDAPVARADLAAIRRACEELPSLSAEERALVVAQIAECEGGPAAADLILPGVAVLIDRGEFYGARLLSERAARLGRKNEGQDARLARLSGQPTALRRDSSPTDDPDLLIERGFARAAAGLVDAALADLRAAVAAAQDRPGLAGHAGYLAGRLSAEQGDAVSAAQGLADAARTLEGAELPREAARVLAMRAACMAKAGAPDRALKELRLAMDRALATDDPHPAALDVRILVGVVFRDAGHRDKARQALVLAAEKARACGVVDREVEARILLARFHLEGMPAAGAGRGEGLRDTRDAAEAALAVVRGLGRPDLEADVESIFGELAWRAEDWAQAMASLAVQEGLHRRAGRHARELETMIRRARLAARAGSWEAALGVAGQAMQAATRRRMTEHVGQAQMLRGEALEKLDRRDDALAAYTEAHRVFRSLGETGVAQAEAAEQRARQLVVSARTRT